MTIKQTGGIFGRNPTFKDVTVGGDLEVTGTSELDGNVAIGAGVTPTWPLTVEKDNDSWISRIYNTGSDADASALLVRTDATAAHNANIIAGYADGGYKLFLKSSGNLELPAGNLVIGTSGKGIDFSATSGTGTSELFDDYEEGTFTPAYQGVSGGSWTYSSQSGTYAKIGNMVNVRGEINTSAGSGLTGNVEINLPYAPATNTTGSLMVSNLTKTVDSQISMFTVSAGKTRIYEFRNNGPYVAKTYANLGAAHTLFFTISYLV